MKSKEEEWKKQIALMYGKGKNTGSGRELVWVRERYKQMERETGPLRNLARGLLLDL